MWLAERGWQVTGVDLSTTALEYAATHAAQRGLAITWQHLDLIHEPATGIYDFVTTFFRHLPAAPRKTLFAHLAAAVAPGWTLLVVGHDLSDSNTTMPRPDLSDMAWPADEVAASLGDGWTIETAQARPRSATDPDGRDITIHDAVLRGRRNPV